MDRVPSVRPLLGGRNRDTVRTQESPMFLPTISSKVARYKQTMVISVSNQLEEFPHKRVSNRADSYSRMKMLVNIILIFVYLNVFYPTFILHFND